MPNCDPTMMTEWLNHARSFDSLSDDKLAGSNDDLPRARRLLLFCNATNDFFGSDPEDVTDRTGPEYGIYQLDRYDTRVLRLATTFAGFVLDYCFGGALKPSRAARTTGPTRVLRALRDPEADVCPVRFSPASSTARRRRPGPGKR